MVKESFGMANIIWIVLGVAFAVIIIFSIWNNKSRGFHTTQQKRQVSTPNSFKSKEEYNQLKAQRIKEVGEKSPVLIVCPHCDEKIQKDITKCPYCAENISDLEKEDKDKQKNREKPIIMKESSYSITSSDIHFQEQIPANALSTNQIKDDYATELKKKMMKIERLFAEGIISKEEFNSRRAQLINEYIDE
jgi:hypothetical protein